MLNQILKWVLVISSLLLVTTTTLQLVRRSASVLKRWLSKRRGTAVAVCLVVAAAMAYMEAFIFVGLDCIGQFRFDELHLELLHALCVIFALCLAVLLTKYRSLRDFFTFSLAAALCVVFQSVLVGVAIGLVNDLVGPRPVGGTIIGPFPWWFEFGLAGAYYGVIFSMPVGLVAGLISRRQSSGVVT
jgi:hypothetical protein